MALFNRIGRALLCVTLVIAWKGIAAASVATPTAPTPTGQAVTATMLGMPLQFEANHGQVDDQVKFLARGKGYTLFLTPTESVMVLSGREANTPTADRIGEYIMALTFATSQQGANTQVDDRIAVGPLLNTEPFPITQSVVRMKLEGANLSPTVSGMEQLSGIVNYFIGNDPAKWRTKIPTYAKVQYQEVYPGIDLAYYGNQGKLEYDFIVAPGADPGQIKLAFEGASDIKVAKSGDLLLATALGDVRLQKPIVYQLEQDGHKTLVSGNYVVAGPSGRSSMVSRSSPTRSVGIQLAAYDHSKPVVIDPVVVYSTYLGGSSQDLGRGIAVDGAGAAYVTGDAISVNFPVLSPSQGTFAGNDDAFVTKFDATGARVYSTYLGGSGADIGHGIAVDGAGAAYITGQTASSNFPVLSASQGALAGPGTFDAFVTKLDATGARVYSTYLGGSDIDEAYGIAVDGAGAAYVTGRTASSNFPVLSASQGGHAGLGDAFITKLVDKPIADAGVDQSVLMGTLVTLNGTGSSGASLTYSWSQVPGGPSVALTGPTTAHPTFTAPTVPSTGGNVTLQLVVCEGSSSNCSDPATVNVHITNVNRPPVAEAGPDQTVQEGSPIILDGSASYDPDVEPLTYTWLQVFGTPVTLVSPNTATPSFTAPPVGAGGGQVDFELIVTDARGLNHSDYISISISNVNQPPITDAGPDQTLNENTLVTLDGSASSDPDLDTLHFSWSQTGGPVVSLTGANTAAPTFTAPTVGPGGALLTFQLVVNDGQASGGTDTVRIAIQDVNDPPVCTLAQPSVSVLWPPNHTMVAVSIMGVTDPNNSDVIISYPTVTQDEPINGLGDGDTSPDAAVSGNNILLRAERVGTGNGRVYVVHFTATAAESASCSGTVKVSVPHSKNAPAVEGPQLHNSFGP